MLGNACVWSTCSFELRSLCQTCAGCFTVGSRPLLSSSPLILDGCTMPQVQMPLPVSCGGQSGTCGAGRASAWGYQGLRLNVQLARQAFVFDPQKNSDTYAILCHSASRHAMRPVSGFSSGIDVPGGKHGTMSAPPQNFCALNHWHHPCRSPAVAGLFSLVENLLVQSLDQSNQCRVD